MTSSSSNHRSSFTRFFALGTVVAALVALGSGCEIGGKEGDRCNALVLQDECNAGLHCKLATCSEAYCCPTNRTSTDPHCNAEGCPDPDAGDDGGTDAAADGAVDSGVDAAVDAAVDSASDAGPTDGGDGG